MNNNNNNNNNQEPMTEETGLTILKVIILIYLFTQIL